jgi:MFS family permease
MLSRVRACVSLQGEFTWDRQFQGYLLSSYFYGYTVTQVLGGWLSGRYGGKHVMATGTLVSVLATLLTPSAARWNRFVVIALRVVLGAGSVSRQQPLLLSINYD